MKNRISGLLTNLLIFAFGFLSLLSPFLFPQTRNSNATFPIIVSGMIILCLLVVFYEIQISILDSKIIAFLGILIAINAGLRFLENAIPGPAGFSPTFFLIILTGYTFGGRIGFLMGALTILVSGLITGGVGPWLPGQMITAGWVGQSSTLLGSLTKKLKWRGKTIEIIALAVFSAFWGMLYGAIMNLWFWPFLGAIAGQSWSQSLNLLENIQRYTAYYLASSLVWDVTRSVGNIIMVSLLTKTVLTIFGRFQRRFNFQYQREPK